MYTTTGPVQRDNNPPKVMKKGLAKALLAQRATLLHRPAETTRRSQYSSVLKLPKLSQKSIGDYNCESVINRSRSQ